MAGWNEWVPGANMTLSEVLDAFKRARKGLDVHDKFYWTALKIIELAIKEGNANFDVEMAKGVYNTLKDRLDAGDLILEDSFNSLRDDLNKIVSGSPKGVYATLAELITAYPTGAEGVYLVTNTGEWHYWSGGEWKSGGLYQEGGLSESVLNDLKKTDSIIRESPNLFNKDDVVTGYHSVTNGAFFLDEKYRTSGPITAKQSTLYSQTARFNGGKTFWDASGNFISGTSTDSPFTTPPATAEIKVSVATSDIGSIQPQLEQFMLVEGEMLDKYYPFDYYKLNEDKIAMPETWTKWKGKTWCALGDSITHGYGSAGNRSYVDIVSESKQMTGLNYGITNSGIAVIPGRTDEMSTRYADMPAGADLITVFGGTNDHAHRVALGERGDAVNTTFYGALKILIEGLINKYPDKLIIFFTPLHKSSGDDTTLNDYAEAIRIMCRDYGVPVFDARNLSGIQPLVTIHQTMFMPDGLHPNLAGQERLADRLNSYLDAV